MSFLLDTHILLWLLTGDKRLAPAVRTALLELENMLYLSAVSVWEINVKYRLGKLTLPESPEILIAKIKAEHNILELPFDEADALQLAALPDLHRDPFDRMLMCQAIRYDLTLVTADEMILAYPIQVLDAR